MSNQETKLEIDNRKPRELKLKVGDKVNCTRKGSSWEVWNGATVVDVDPNFQAFPYTCICDEYGPDNPGLFMESELELAR